nr:hypothetical protein [Tanacetum cinerariifolium]
SKPPGFEKFIKKGESPSLNSVMNDYMEDPKEVEDKEVGSNINIPHRFENVLKVCKGVSHSPSRTTEVGGALGNDVKGCKRSLRKMINMIGVSMADK